MKLVVGTVGREDDLLVIVDETGSIIVVEIVGEILEGACAEAIDKNVRLSVLEAREQQQLTIGGERDVGNLLHIYQQPFLTFFLFNIIRIIVATSRIFDGETHNVTIGMPGQQREGEVGIVFCFMETMVDATRFLVALAIHPDGHFPRLVGNVSIALAVGRKAELVVVALGLGAFQQTIVRWFIPFYIFFIKNIIITIPIDEQLFVRHASHIKETALVASVRAGGEQDGRNGRLAKTVAHILPEGVPRIHGIHLREFAKVGVFLRQDAVFHVGIYCAVPLLADIGGEARKIPIRNIQQTFRRDISPHRRAVDDPMCIEVHDAGAQHTIEMGAVAIEIEIHLRAINVGDTALVVKVFIVVGEI